MSMPRAPHDDGTETASARRGAAPLPDTRRDSGSYSLFLHRDTVLASWGLLAQAFGIPLPPEHDEHAPAGCRDLA